MNRAQLRFPLLALALVFLAWEGYGARRWVLDAGGMAPAGGRFWRLLGSDWMMRIVVTDHLLLAAIVLALLWLDATRNSWAPRRRVLLGVAFVALGSPVVLGYLAWRIGADRFNVGPRGGPSNG
jgi:hypothetical protein